MPAPDEAPAMRAGAPRTPSPPARITLVLDGPIRRADIASLCERLDRLLEAEGARAASGGEASDPPGDPPGAGTDGSGHTAGTHGTDGGGDGRHPVVVQCDVGGVARPDAATLDALARLQLTARRAGGTLHLRAVSPGLQGLLRLTGLADVLGMPSGEEPPDGEGSGLEVVGQAEEGEQPLGVEEGVEADDPAV